MRLKGALHVHSTFSHDGTLTISELSDWYRERGYDFFALGEHSQDMDREKIVQMCEQCARCSSDKFLVIPGLEYSCRGGIHLFAAGSTLEIHDTDPAAVATKARAEGAFVIMAHPSRLNWKVSRDIISAVDAVEFWNVGYDGKYLPSFKALGAFRRMRDVNPLLLATGGQDFHRKAAFYDVAMSVEVESLTAKAILGGLRAKNYEIRSRFFRSNADARFSLVKAAALSLFSWQISAARGSRELLRRWIS